MRAIFILFILSFFLLSEINGQEKNNGLGLTFSLIHPVKYSLREYQYAADPTLEVLYSASLSRKIRVAGGIYVQAGKHNWLELYGHTFYDDNGIGYRLRTDYNRQLEFISVGIPVKFEIITGNFIFNSFVFGFTAGNHIKLELADYYESEFVAGFPAYEDFNNLFREVNLGLKKNIFQSGAITLSLLPVAGYRKETSRIADTGYYNYMYYGLGLSARFVK